MSADEDYQAAPRPKQPPHEPPPPPSWPARLGWMLHATLVCAVVGISIYTCTVFFRAMSRREAPPPPDVMETVNWTSADSSPFCLACHRPVGPAMAGLDVTQGHPQNVKLSPAQLEAVAALGTFPGNDGTLICVTCHKLGAETMPYMLADSLVDGRFCEHCHPGHYARNTPHDLRRTAPDELNRLGQTVAAGGPCSACHLAHYVAREFVPCDHDPDGRCTTCHAVDRCAQSHPRAGMDHPETRCLECHDPHDADHGAFLKQPPAELCIECHPTYANGPDAGMHPLAPLTALPDTLTDAGAWPVSDVNQINCTHCHAIHTSTNETLLVCAPDTNNLCQSCHGESDSAALHAASSHDRSPALNIAQRSVVDHLRTRTGSNGELLCLSCHRVHDGNINTPLLAFSTRYEETCLGCHPQQVGVVGSAHDLRIEHPHVPNLAGMTPLAHGACSACHLAHGDARGATTSPADPGGRCITCHAEGQCAEARPVGGVPHPDTQCTDCHDPHERDITHFLNAPQSDLCFTCHPEHARLVGGPHDRGPNPDRWPANTATVVGPCLGCHVPHGGERGDLFRTHGEDLALLHDDVCLVCHAETNWNASSAVAAIHPREISPNQDKVALALIPAEEAGSMRIGCRTCHDPHGGLQPTHLARVAADEPDAVLCLHCHEQKQYIRHTGHAADSLKRFGLDVDSCRPCHAMHANPDGSWGQMLSPRFLMEQCSTVTDPATTCMPCLGCHHADGPAPVRAIAVHPIVETTLNLVDPGEPGYLPLYDARGHVDPQGRVTCRTCHLSHGQLDLLRFIAENQQLTKAEQHLVRAQLRPFTPPNICTQCHGVEARFRFLFFHDPERRQHGK